MTDITINAKDVTVVKGKEAVLKKLNFTVRPGVITGLLGPSGSGKTTLIRSVVGVQKLTSGQLTVLNRPAGSPVLRSSIGYVTQAPAVYNDLTVIQNLRYFATLTGATKTQTEAILDRVQLREHRTHLVENLSGGQRTRVSLAVALLGDPELLVLDEPTVGLDPILREDLWKLFQELATQGKTLVISSHVMDEAEKCEQLLLLRDGELLWNDTRGRLLEKTKEASVEKAFIRIITEREAV